MVLQPPVRAGTAVYEVGQQYEMLSKQADTCVDVLKVVSLWVPDILLGDVWKYAVSNMVGGGWHSLSVGSDQAVLDVSDPVGVDIHGRLCTGLDCTVQLWLL